MTISYINSSYIHDTYAIRLLYDMTFCRLMFYKRTLLSCVWYFTVCLTDTSGSLSNISGDIWWIIYGTLRLYCRFLIFPTSVLRNCSLRFSPTTVIRNRFVIQFMISFFKLVIKKLITSCFYHQYKRDIFQILMVDWSLDHCSRYMTCVYYVSRIF